MCKLNLVILMVCLATAVGTRAANPTDTPLGEINIRLSANIVDYTCYATSGDADKTVQLGVWPTKQFRNAGDTTQKIPFSLKLAGCPPSGTTSVTFSGANVASDVGLLALNSSSTATRVAVELHNQDKTRLNLNEASQEVASDVNGDATLTFYANYIALGGNATPGSANADATFVINYE